MALLSIKYFRQTANKLTKLGSGVVLDEQTSFVTNIETRRLFRFVRGNPLFSIKCKPDEEEQIMGEMFMAKPNWSSSKMLVKFFDSNNFYF